MKKKTFQVRSLIKCCEGFCHPKEGGRYPGSKHVEIEKGVLVGNSAPSREGKEAPRGNCGGKVRLEDRVFWSRADKNETWPTCFYFARGTTGMTRNRHSKKIASYVKPIDNRFADNSLLSLSNFSVSDADR